MINKFIFILLLGEILLLDCLKINDNGVCTIKSAPKTRVRTYIVTLNKRCGKKKCTQKKTKVEKYNVADILVCCNGWEYNNTKDICEPLCRTGCSQGLCISPDVCECTPPLYLDSISKNSCITPKCYPSCVNSICVDTNNCSCDINYIPHNNTHCVPNCLPKYEIDWVTLTCKPICDTPCDNGTCIDGKCDCNDGYELNDNTCKPKCDPECENADCIQPNTCSCYKDYIATDAKTKCKALCENCDNGRCDEPNNCKCNDGYMKVNNTCIPFCADNCINGYLSSPNDLDVCNCYEEYTGNNSQICMKVVDCNENKDSFKNCTLEQEEHTITKPVKCTRRPCPHKTVKKIVCCPRYYLDNKIKVCQPHCIMGCDGGRCVEPDKCQCDPPLVLNNETNACILPTCDPPCINAECTGTNICACYEGYTETDNSSVCEPKCEACDHGDCVSPNECRCHVGYVNIHGVCEPNCGSGCKNGYCSVPNHCTCDPGFKHNEIDNLICIPNCDPECVNSTCKAPNLCECNAGYKPKSNVTNNICSPVCDPPCTNAYCSEPNVCTCHDGYSKTDNSSICEAKCEACNHGDCVSPNECRCHVGYLNIKGICEPNCGSACKNGYCSAPNYCTCDPGFKHNKTDNLTCIPDCGSECINSTCKAPNLCECYDGFERVDTRSCKPICNNCLNGTCSAPEVCSCDEGYMYENGLCKPICSETCENGFCSSPDTCTCFDGFINNGSIGCFKLCKSDCFGGTCNALGECICDEEYVLMNNTCQPIPMIYCNDCIIDRQCMKNECYCDDGRPCQVDNVEVPESAEATSPVLAVLELTGAVSLVLIILLLVIIVTIWRKRKRTEEKVVDDGHQYGSVVYTVPDTLVKHNETILNEEMNDEVFDNNINDIVEIDTYERNRRSYKREGEAFVESVHPLLTTNNTEL